MDFGDPYEAPPARASPMLDLLPLPFTVSKRVVGYQAVGGPLGSEEILWVPTISRICAQPHAGAVEELLGRQADPSARGQGSAMAGSWATALQQMGPESINGIVASASKSFYVGLDHMFLEVRGQFSGICLLSGCGGYCERRSISVRTMLLSENQFRLLKERELWPDLGVHTHGGL